MTPADILVEPFENFFKPETQSSGRKLVAQEKVFISSAGDTSLQAYVRGAPPLRVTLTSESMDSPLISANCSCPAAKKGQFCKHLWAVFLCVAEKHPDFLAGKSDLEKAETAADPRAIARAEAAASAKQQASERRKEHYQQQKARAKAYKSQHAQGGSGKGARKGSYSREESTSVPTAGQYPPEIEASILYFSENGFPMPEGPSELILSEAKRKLSRVFHPDKGGSHEESVQLNEHCDRVRVFLRNGG
ncbi:MAG: SWIM zinc finger family protein [Methylotenera sp.]|nr:SWIM zinc finger family protein [Oligoflexia bacterium]